LLCHCFEFQFTPHPLSSSNCNEVSSCLNIWLTPLISLSFYIQPKHCQISSSPYLFTFQRRCITIKMAVAPVDDPISSPTSSSMTSSFVVLSNRHHSSSSFTQQTMPSDDSDDEIVYSVSEGLSPSSPSDDDFVVLSRPRAISQSGLSTPSAANDAPTANTEQLARDFTKLIVSDSGSQDGGQKSQTTDLAAPKNRRKGKAARKASAAKVAAESYPSPAPSPARPMPPSSVTQQVKIAAQLKSGKKKKKKAKKAPASPHGFTTRSVVDDVSERLSVTGETESAVGAPSVYEEAVGFITSYVPLPSSDLGCDNLRKSTMTQIPFKSGGAQRLCLSSHTPSGSDNRTGLCNPFFTRIPQICKSLFKVSCVRQRQGVSRRARTGTRRHTAHYVS